MLKYLHEVLYLLTITNTWLYDKVSLTVAKICIAITYEKKTFAGKLLDNPVNKG